VIAALISGKLYGAPTERTAKNGNTYVTAKVRAPTRDGEAQFVNIVAFSGPAVAALLALEDGDAVALTGEMTAKGYTSKDGEPKPSLELLAHQALTTYQVQQKRKTAKPTQDAEPAGTGLSSSTDEFADDIPF
jgi:single-stranded DNA-binding protein